MALFEIIVYISCSSNDIEPFKIKKIAQLVESYMHIKKVIFYKRENFEDIYEFMEDNLEKSDVLLLFCSQNAKNSDYVRKEWSSFDKRKSKVIPIFKFEEDIPFLINTRLGVNILNKEIEQIAEEIYKTILKVFCGGESNFEPERKLQDKIERLLYTFHFENIPEIEIEGDSKEKIKSIIHKYHQQELYPSTYAKLESVKLEVINQIIDIGAPGLVILILEHLKGPDELKDTCEELLDFIFKKTNKNWKKAVKRLKI